MSITDLANNPIAPGGSTSSMLGYIEPPAPGEELTLDMYDFLIRELRDQDRKDGNLFIRRFLLGSQQIWADMQAKIFAVRDLWSITECPDDFLIYLKNIVGWTKQLEHITDGLEAEALRRLIHASVPLWKSRSSENSYVDVINLLFTRRSVVWSWFDKRILSGEDIGVSTVFSEQRQGRDPYLIGDPGGPLSPEYWSTIRVVTPDDKQLLRDVLTLMRPIGERLSVVYLDFLDRFNIEDDVSQWNDLYISLGCDPAVVEDGAIKLEDTAHDQAILANTEGSDDWEHYVVSARVRGNRTPYSYLGFGVLFYMDPTLLNGYFVTFNLYQNQLLFGKLTGGAGTVTDYFDFDDVGYQLEEDVWYGVRVECIPEVGTTRFRVFVDGVERLNVTDSTYTKGTVGLAHNATIRLQCDEIEVLGLPVDSETLEPS